MVLKSVVLIFLGGSMKKNHFSKSLFIISIMLNASLDLMRINACHAVTSYSLATSTNNRNLIYSGTSHRFVQSSTARINSAPAVSFDFKRPPSSPWTSRRMAQTQAVLPYSLVITHRNRVSPWQKSNSQRELQYTLTHHETNSDSHLRLSNMKFDRYGFFFINAEGDKFRII